MREKGGNRLVPSPDYMVDALKLSNLAPREGLPVRVTRRLLAMDLVILNYDQATRTTPELAPSPNYHTTPRGGLRASTYTLSQKNICTQKKSSYNHETRQECSLVRDMQMIKISKPMRQG
ncbi:hypothetical protein TNCV_1870761 [Trichonephila clavipes]|nr:hypothetical protein TNCV_1870761 [Trichonephila clavipes]